MFSVTADRNENKLSMGPSCTIAFSHVPNNDFFERQNSLTRLHRLHHIASNPSLPAAIVKVSLEANREVPPKQPDLDDPPQFHTNLEVQTKKYRHSSRSRPRGPRKRTIFWGSQIDLVFTRVCLRLGEITLCESPIAELS